MEPPSHSPGPEPAAEVQALNQGIDMLAGEGR